MRVGRGVLFKKGTVEAALDLDMKYLARKIDLETPGTTTVAWRDPRDRDDPDSSIGVDVCPPERLRLRYVETDRDGERKKYSYYISLDTTPCFFGGKRWWFLCPECQRRCRIIYGASSSGYFACRLCHDLTYRSQQERPNPYQHILEAALALPVLEAALMRTHSPRTKARVLRKIEKMYGSLAWVIPKDKERNPE